MSLHEQMQACISEANNWMSDRAKKKFGDDSPAARILKRRFGINEAAELAGVTRQSIVKAEKEGRLPTPEYKDTKANRPVRKGFTLAQIENMREVFGTRPHRPEDMEAVVLSIPGGKGGCWKTSTAAHLAQWLSLKGYRVWCIDIDPQAHLSMYFGYHPEINTTAEDTVLDYMLGDKDDLSYCVRETAWPNLHITPSHLQLQRLEREMPEAELEHQLHQMLQAGIDGLKDHYDIVIVDGHPDLGIGTTNMICASDITLIATSTEVNDINSTCQLMGLISDIYAPNGVECTHEPIVRVLPTKLGGSNTSSNQNLLDMRQFWGGLPILNGCYHTDEVGKGQRRMATIYEQADSSERSTPAAWKRATDIFDATFNEILNDLIKPLWAEE
ncbi:AAA family ATPase [Vibrio sp. S4M6]|uniref:AAA family ATPase n=1 Tax=Vibrio sinus TaxID=2946865 RepID=UPI002029D4AE|nr:AAA family ATPase [Vibrio sinus]MCL9783682.1 AAA family ATPase [Vibrio sinus]